MKTYWTSGVMLEVSPRHAGEKVYYAKDEVDAVVAEAIEVIWQLVDVLRRSDPEYCSAQGVAHCYDDEWDDALEAGEDFLEERGQ